MKSVLHREEKPPPAVCQVAATWEPRVLYTPDPTHGGAPTPGLAGRLYLFGEETGFPLVGDGSVVVDLYDDTPVASGGQAKLLEKWCLDKDTLKRLQRRDMIGEGYTLFLPWGTYKPETSQVHLMVCYTTQKGIPLYAPSSSVTLNGGNTPLVQATSRTVIPAPAPAAPSAGPVPMAPVVASSSLPAAAPAAPPQGTLSDNGQHVRWPR